LRRSIRRSWKRKTTIRPAAQPDAVIRSRYLRYLYRGRLAGVKITPAVRLTTLGACRDHDHRALDKRSRC
jgi:hypothetical protein